MAEGQVYFLQVIGIPAEHDLEFARFGGIFRVVCPEGELGVVDFVMKSILVFPMLYFNDVSVNILCIDKGNGTCAWNFR
jgi:hypothetical protein